MSTITFVALLTASGGAPATGLTLSDINLYLYAININTGAETEIWNTQNPTAEITNMGMYIRQYTSADLATYQYVGRANYSGGSTLDSNNVYIAFASAEVNPASTITVVSPLASDGEALTLVRGDDYNATDARYLRWSSASWPDVTGATIYLNYWNPQNRGERQQITGSVVSSGGGTQIVQATPTAAQTVLMEIGKRRYKYEVSATLSSGREVTLVSSDSSWLTVVESYE